VLYSGGRAISRSPAVQMHIAACMDHEACAEKPDYEHSHARRCGFFYPIYK